MSSIGSAAVMASTAVASSTFANQPKTSKAGPGTPRSTLKAVDSFGNSSFDSSLDSPTVHTNSGLLSRFNFLVSSKTNGQSEISSKEPLNSNNWLFVFTQIIRVHVVYWINSTSIKVYVESCWNKCFWSLQNKLYSSKFLATMPYSKSATKIF